MVRRFKENRELGKKSLRHKLRESVDSNPFMESKYANLIDPEYMNILGTLWSKLRALTDKINNHLDILEDYDAKVHDVFYNFDEIDDFWLQDQWDYFSDFVKEHGCTIESANRSGSHFYIRNSFLSNLANVTGNHVATVDEGEVLSAVYDTVLGGYSELVSNASELDEYIDWNLEKYYEEGEPTAEDIKEILNDIIDDYEYMARDGNYVFRHMNEYVDDAIEVVDYIKSFKDNQVSFYQDYIDANDFSESIRRSKRGIGEARIGRTKMTEGRNTGASDWICLSLDDLVVVYRNKELARGTAEEIIDVYNSKTKFTPRSIDDLKSATYSAIGESGGLYIYSGSAYDSMDHGKVKRTDPNSAIIDGERMTNEEIAQELWSEAMNDERQYNRYIDTINRFRDKYPDNPDRVIGGAIRSLVDFYRSRHMIRVGNIYQRVKDYLYDGVAEDVNYNKDIPTESIKRNRRKHVNESPVYTDADMYDAVAEEVAQYMGYSADQAYDELQSDPQSIIDYLEDEEDYDNNRSLINKIEKYFL